MGLFTVSICRVTCSADWCPDVEQLGKRQKETEKENEREREREAGRKRGGERESERERDPNPKQEGERC